jgi:hypothetical protein
MIRGHLKSSLWAAVGGAAVLTVGAVTLRWESGQLWLLPGMAFFMLIVSLVVGVPIALGIGVPISAWLRHIRCTQSGHYVVAGLLVSIAAYAIYFSYRWWWQPDDPMFPTLPTSIRTIGLSAILRFEVIAAISILLVGPVAACCHWKSEQHVA